MITKRFLLLFLQIKCILAAPLQMLQPLQGIMQQQMVQPFRGTTLQQYPLLQQLQMMAQKQMSLHGEMQQMSLPEPIQQQFPLLPALQGTFQQQRLGLQEQMFALQQFQALQKMNLVPSSVSALNALPILVIYPNDEQDELRTDSHTNTLKYQKPEDVGDDDSEIIDAEPTEETNVKTSSMRAFLIMPNTRSFIGDFISSIPFLPIEINVPDSIGWIYNGIAGIIAGITQSLPFRPQPPNVETQIGENTNNNIRAIWNKVKMKQQMPIVVIPLGQT